MRVLLIVVVFSLGVLADDVADLAAWYRARKSLPDLLMPAFVVVEFDGRPHEWGFAQPGGRVLTGDLRTLTFTSERYRVRDREFSRFVVGHLDGSARRRILFDFERGDPYSRFATLIVALELRGQKELARNVFERSRRWLAKPVAEMKAGLGLAALHRLRARVGSPGRRWKVLADKYAALRRDFPLHVMIDDLAALRATAALTPADGLAFTLRDTRKDWRKRPGDRSRKLVARSFAAVPELLALADDRRYTRIVVSAGRNVDAPRRLGAHVRDVLSEIAGRRFTTAREARTWWAAAGELGEKRYLIRTVGFGGAGAAHLAARLAKQAPDAAVAAIKKGLRFTPQPVDRVVLVHALDPRRPAARALLLAVLERDEAPIVAVAAAELVGSHEREFVRKSLRARWEANATGEVAGLLGRLGLPFDPVRLSVRARLDLARSDAPESVLVQQLDDNAFVGGEVEGLRHFVRVCDVAARSLARLAPDRYDFDDADPEPVRDRCIASIRNRYRIGRGLEPLAEPAPPRPPALSLREALDLGDLLSSRPQLALRGIEDAGIRAAPWINRWLQRSLDRDTRATLEKYRAAQHTTLAFVEIVGSEELARKLRPAHGYVFDGNDVMPWLVGRTDQVLSGVDRYTFVLWREPGMPGVCLRVLAGKKKASRGPRHVALVRSDGRTLFTAFRDGAPARRMPYEFTRSANVALTAPEPFEIKIVVRR